MRWNVSIASWLPNRKTETPTPFVDKAIDNLYRGLNLSLDKRIGGERGAGMGYGAAGAYSFINGVSLDEFANPQWGQLIVVSASLAFVGGKRFGGADAGEKSNSIVPRIGFWLPKSGRQLRAGVDIPVSETHGADRIFRLQIGNHLNWDDLLAGRSRDQIPTNHVLAAA